MSYEIEGKANELCDQIRTIYPEVGECGLDVDVWFDVGSETWKVRFAKDAHELETHIEPEDVTACLEGRHCLHLGVQVEQLVKNVRA